MRMKNVLLMLFAACLGAQIAVSQPFVDCSCLANQSVLRTNACQGVIPDMCQFSNCFQNAAFPPAPYTCSQSPAAGGIVSPGTYPIPITVQDINGVASQCVVNFVVTSPSTR